MSTNDCLAFQENCRIPPDGMCVQDKLHSVPGNDKCADCGAPSE